MEELLKKLQKINPTLTKDRLMEELRKSSYATVAILLTMENVKEGCHN